MTDLDTLITDLRAKAEAATPGPWEPLPGAKHAAVIRRNKDGALGAGIHAKLIISADLVDDDVVVGVDEEDRAYIAAANPAAIFTILDALDEARGELERRYDPGYVEDLLRVVSATDQNWREVQAELAALRADNERLRSALHKAARAMECRSSGMGVHYCPSCDNTSWDAQQNALAAITPPSPEAALRTKRHATCDQKLASLAKTLTERDAELATLRAEVEELGLANGSTQDFRPNHPTGGHAMSDSKPKYRWLKNCPPGLFVTKDGCLGFKSEYSTILPDCFYQCDAYVVKSGEYFGGGAATPQIRDKILVRWISADALLAKLGEDRKS